MLPCDISSTLLNDGEERNTGPEKTEGEEMKVPVGPRGGAGPPAGLETVLQVQSVSEKRSVISLLLPGRE